MRCAKHPVIRNKIDLTDPNQVRAWKRRLGVLPTIFKGWLKKSVSRFQRLPKKSNLKEPPANTVQGMAKRPFFEEDIVTGGPDLTGGEAVD
jgi:hypothetical protein